MSRHGDRRGQIADFRGSFETINWLYLLFKRGIKTKTHFQWLLWHWSSLGQLNLEPTRPNGLVSCKVPTDLVKISVKEATHMGFYHIGIYVREGKICQHLCITVTSHKQHGVSNHRQPDCLSNSLTGPTAKKTSKLGNTVLCERNSSVDSPHKWPVMRETFQSHGVIVFHGCYSWTGMYYLLECTSLSLHRSKC